MKTSARLFYFLSLIFVLSLAVSAQTATPTPTPKVTGDGGVIKTIEVRLPVIVKDKKKNLVAGLTRGDFVVLEDGVPQEITFFTDEKTNPPVYVGVLMDTSPSTAGKIAYEKESARNFIYT